MLYGRSDKIKANIGYQNLEKAGMVQLDLPGSKGFKEK